MSHSTATEASRSLAVLTGLAVAALLGVGTSAAAPIYWATASVSGAANNGATLSARFTPAAVDTGPAGDLVATGTLTGTLVDPTGAGHRVAQRVTLPVEHPAGTDGCSAGDLVLEPVTLDLFGTVVRLDPSHLETTGVAPRSCTAERLVG